MVGLAINCYFLDQLQHGTLENVKWSISWGADINQKMRSGKTPLMYAISNRQSIFAQTLINAGADIHLQDDSGWNALMYAVYAQENEIVKTLLDLGADVHTRSNNGNSALILSVEEEQGNIDILQQLLDAGADAGIDNMGRSIYNFSHMFRFPLENRTALMTAAYYGHEAALKLLLERGANVNLKSANHAYGRTALDCATASHAIAIRNRPKQENMLKLLNSAIHKADDELKEVIIHYPTASETKAVQANVDYTLLKLYNKSIDKPVLQQITDEIDKMKNYHFKKFQTGIV